jgi:hypothetical protein
MLHRAKPLWIVCALAVSSYLGAAEPLPLKPDRTSGRGRLPTNNALDRITSKEKEDLPETKVTHLEYSLNGWDLAESPNFRIYHKERPKFAEKVAQTAERTRVLVQRKWFGSVDEAWSPRCQIYLHETAEEFTRATGVPGRVPGYTMIRADGTRVLDRRIDLCCEDSALLTAVLPHETTHAVTAGRFGEVPVPHWANEGMAILGEPQDKIDGHLKRLDRFRREGDLFPAEQLIEFKNYPEKRLVGAFYAESLSLVDFLTQEKGPKTFTRFMRDGLLYGYDWALKRNYGWDLDELDGRWRKFAFGTR